MSIGASSYTSLTADPTLRPNLASQHKFMRNALFACNYAALADDATPRLVERRHSSDGLRVRLRASGRPDGGVERLHQQGMGGVAASVFNLFKSVLPRRPLTTLIGAQ